ncbi:FAD-dependent oxidoreductase [Enterococcus montenegrensis]|uniref:FAD-dependent oxidoreductase n=1 Tax=Enterococcus montenegrensis TaxID=3031993 RepID=UPI00249F1718|nr:FAD-dependent oxidoreductase [Enterococcus montenegrensis]WHA09129.1 FAD-dependent oxidoreductase [Enterococcus montenegrensis]
MRTVIIGASHSGIQTALTLKQLCPTMDVIILEKTQDIGFISSGINFVLTKKIDDLTQSHSVTPRDLLNHGIVLIRQAEVTSILPKEKQIFYTYSGKTNENFNYDFLVLAMGSSQFYLDISGSELENILTYKNVQESKEALKVFAKSKEITIIGTGYIGMELAYALSGKNKKIHLVEQMDSILFRYFDKEMVHEVINQLPKDIKLHMNTSALAFEGENGKVTQTLLSEGKIHNDAVVVAVNARPNTTLVEDFLEFNLDGTVVVNEFLQTKYQNIYAVGDLISVPLQGTEISIYMPLVNNAIRTGIVAAENIVYRNKIKLQSTQKTSVTRLGSYYLARTGLTQEEAPYYGKEVIAVADNFKDYGLENEFSKNPVLKLIFEKKGLKLIGAQYVSKFPRLELINLLANAIQKNETALTLSQMEAFFNPLFSNPLHYIQQLALQALVNNNE